MIKRHNLDPTVRSGLIQIPRETIHVCKPNAANADYLYDNIPRGHLFHTINEAMAVAQAYFDVLVWPGEYKELATVAITQDHLKLLAVETGVHGRCFNQTAIYQYANVDTPCCSIEASGVEVAGLWFIPYDPGTLSTGINVAQLANARGCFIHHNYFYGVASGATGPCHVRLGVDGSYDAESAYIYKNDFYCGGASNDSIGQLEWNSATRGQVVENNFWTQGNVATAFAINIYDAAGPRGGIFDNRFMNIEVGLSGSEGIAINNPAGAGGDVQIDGNVFINYQANTNLMASKSLTVLGRNWFGGTIQTS